MNQEQNTPALQNRMEQELQKYQEMLEWTGGALTLTKCFFSILEWAFHPNGLPKIKDQNIHSRLNEHSTRKNK